MHVLRHRASPRRALPALLAPALALAGLTLLPSGAASAAAAPDPGSRASTPSCGSTSCTQTFSYTGALESFTVPAGVASLAVQVAGAQGGNHESDPGGKGGRVIGTLTVTAGDELTVLVGQRGTGGGGSTFGGGAAGPAAAGGSGGGGSFVFDTADGAALLVGGGGGGTNFITSTTGGVGGGATGSGGTGHEFDGWHGDPATGGSQSAGGVGGSTPAGDPYPFVVGTAGGNGTGPAASGMPGRGGAGNAANDEITNPYDNGAGGGGGYYGGGGGASRQDGAGGSGYAAPSVTVLSSDAGVREGDGLVDITWTKPSSSTSLDVSPEGASSLGDDVTLTATVAGAYGTASGEVDFVDGSSPIVECQDVALVDGAAECTFAPPAGDHVFGALYDARGTTTYASSSATTVAHTVTAPVSVITTELPDATVGTAYDESLVAEDGELPYTWEVTSGALPDGIELSTDGDLTGTPTIDGSSSFTVTVTDTGDPATSDTQDLTLVVQKGHVAVGSPTIVAGLPATVGVTLTCAAPAGTIGDVTYAWVTGETLLGDTPDYTPSPGDLDRRLRCIITVERAGYDTVSNDVVTDEVLPGSFTIDASAISGTARVGDPLTCAAAPGTPGDVSYEWFSGDTSIAVGAGYTPDAGDLGAVLTCVVTAQRAGYVDATSSADSDEVAAASAGAYTVRVAGKPKVGLKLRASITPDPTVPTCRGCRAGGPAVTWQWYADGVAIPGATKAWFRPSYDELGSRVVARATVVVPGEETTTVASARTARIVIRAVLFTVEPGTVRAGGVVWATIGRVRPGQRFSIALGDGKVLLAGTVPTSGGTFTRSVRIPAGASHGDRRLVLTLKDPDVRRSVPLQVR